MVSMDHNGVKVNTPYSQSIIIKEYNFLFNVDMVNLLLKNNGGRGGGQKASFCYFCRLKSSNCRRVGGGGLGQKFLFRVG